LNVPIRQPNLAHDPPLLNRHGNYNTARNLFGDGGPTIREQRFMAAAIDQIKEAAAAKETSFSGARKVVVACRTWRSLVGMKDETKKTRKALASYENMLTHPNVREGLRAAFADAGFAPIDAARSLAELASGRSKTVVTTQRTTPEGEFNEVKTTEHPPNVAALKAYYEMTHESAPSRHEHLNVNVDVMKQVHSVPDTAPRAVGELGPARNGEINVFAEDHDEDEPEEPEHEKE
jgi:hypothetical protein